MSRIHKSLAVVLALALLVGGSAWLYNAKRGHTLPIRVGLNIWPGYGAFFIADEKGYFKRAGLAVDLKIIQSDTEREAALAAGQLDGVGMTIDNMVILRNRGVDVRAIFKYDSSAGADGIIAKNGIESIKDLRGRRVGWASATTSHFMLAARLARENMTTRDLQQVQLSADDAGAAFAAGTLDAAVTWEPWLSKAKQGGQGNILVTTREFPVIEDVLFFRTTTLIERREQISLFLRACFETIEYWKQNQDEGNAIIAKRLSLPLEEIKEMLGGINIMTLADNRSFFGEGRTPSPATQAYELAVRTWISEGVITQGQDPAKALARIMRQA